GVHEYLGRITAPAVPRRQAERAPNPRSRARQRVPAPPTGAHPGVEAPVGLRRLDGDVGHEWLAQPERPGAGVVGVERQRGGHAAGEGAGDVAVDDRGGPAHDRVDDEGGGGGHRREERHSRRDERRQRARAEQHGGAYGRTYGGDGQADEGGGDQRHRGEDRRVHRFSPSPVSGGRAPRPAQPGRRRRRGTARAPLRVAGAAGGAARGGPSTPRRP